MYLKLYLACNYLAMDGPTSAPGVPNDKKYTKDACHDIDYIYYIVTKVHIDFSSYIAAYAKLLLGLYAC